jgi:hypothetical protein
LHEKGASDEKFTLYERGRRSVFTSEPKFPGANQ